MRHLSLWLIFFLIVPANAQVPQPLEDDHPGSATYQFESQRKRIMVDGRRVELFYPIAPKSYRAPVYIYGHGYGAPTRVYQDTFEHLAQKGVAIVYPQYEIDDNDFIYRRMAADFNKLAEAGLRELGSLADRKNIHYAGHSLGGQVALMALGAPNLLKSQKPQSVLLFAPYGFDSSYLNKMDPTIPLSLFWGEKDDTSTEMTQNSIYRLSPAKHKQLITLKDYPTQPIIAADHLFPLTNSGFFGGPEIPTAFHYHGVWKWMLGAVYDVQEGNQKTNIYLYGDEVITSGLKGFKHKVKRNW
ncbi:MAG: hypothetical protein AAF203_05845 [Pseudomonadota bacterium]